jgi:AraC family transcriptional regulator, transcriptional activator of pobA
MSRPLNQDTIWNTETIAKELCQNHHLQIAVSASGTPFALPMHHYEKFLVPHKGSNYFFMFFERGTTEHQLDLQPLTVLEGELLFTLPNQVHTAPRLTEETKYYTLGFTQNSSSLLPQQFPFLVNPFNTPKISFDEPSKHRVIHLFEILNQLLHTNNSNTDTLIIIAYLNSLLTEFNSAYFRNSSIKTADNGDISTFIQFKTEIENNLREQPSIASIASGLSLSEDKLCKIVKRYSARTPKEYLVQRLMLEAQRILFYDKISTKELAYELGFSDPDYFSRLFKKCTGKSISEFLNYCKELSRH